MNRRSLLRSVLLAGLFCPLPGRGIEAPLPADPPVYLPEPPVQPASPGLKASATGVLPVYSIGDPTDDEQLYLELINRARANPAREAAILAGTTNPALLSAYAQFGVDLALMTQQITAFAPTPPLSFNSKLILAARGHTQDMLANQWQNHSGSDGSTALSRAQREGYSPVAVAENIYSYAENTEIGHAGFEVDWGDSTAIGSGGVTSIVGGMQFPAGHRANIHSPTYREIGIGVTNTVRNVVGPQLVTEDFGTPSGAKPFITGVVYFDFNTNAFYDLGEGIGGINVDVVGASFTAVTAHSGGYSVPVPGNGTYTVTFSYPGATPITRTVTVANSANVKLDLIQPYAAPTVLGTATPGIGAANVYQITPVFGATGYQWSSSQSLPAASLGAEDAGASVQPFISTAYPLISTQVKAAGAAAYHLLNPEASPQWFVLKPSYSIRSQATLEFMSRLGGAASDQFARVQVSKDDGLSWATVYSQPGANSFGEGTFIRRVVDISAYANNTVRIRFLFDFDQGKFTNDTDPDYGWYVDEIKFTNVDTPSNEVISTVPQNQFSFVPTSPATQVLRTRPVIQDRLLQWGPPLQVQPTTVVLPPTIQIKALALGAGGDTRLDFDLVNGATAGLHLESAGSPKGPWTELTGGQIALVTGNTYRATFKRGTGPVQFFRLRAN